MTLSAFLTVALFHLAAAISPGPSFVVSVRVAASEGFWVATALAAGFGFGAALWAGAAMAGLAVLFELLPELLLALKLAGALFLLFIAVMMWRHAAEPIADVAENSPRSAISALRFGLLTFLSNPKPAVFFGAIFVGLVPAETPVSIMALLIAMIFLNETLWYILVARVFSTARARDIYARLKTGIDRAFGILIGALGVKIAIG